MTPDTNQTTWHLLLGWITDHHIGDLASVAGVAISVIGFLVTIIGVFKSQGAAERAEQAAKETRESIRLLDSVVDFSSAISTLEEIKRMHRQGNWALLPDRYATIRKLLIALRNSGEALTDAQGAVIQSALVNLRSIEAQVERSLRNADTLKPARFNALISDDVDNLVAVLTQLKSSKVGG